MMRRALQNWDDNNNDDDDDGAAMTRSNIDVHSDRSSNRAIGGDGATRVKPERRPRASTGPASLPAGNEPAEEWSKGVVLDEFSFIRDREHLLGKGSFADVYRGVKRRTGEIVAVKVVDLARLSRGNPKLLEHVEDEMSIAMELKHENIVRLFSVQHLDSETLCMVFEYCNAGDMGDYLKIHRILPERDALHFMRQLAAGLRYVRELNIVHRDIKPHNLLLATADSSLEKSLPTLKIADFGFARVLEPSNLADTICGSPLYMAPEILRGQNYSSKADLWSVGAVLFEMVVGSPPFPAKSHVELIRLIQASGETSIALPASTRTVVSGALARLITGLLHTDPTNRISWTEFFMHEWLTGEETGGANNKARQASAPTFLEQQLDILPFRTPVPGYGGITIPDRNRRNERAGRRDSTANEATAHAHSAPSSRPAIPATDPPRRAGMLGKLDRLRSRTQPSQDPSGRTGPSHRQVLNSPPITEVPTNANEDVSSFGSRSPPLKTQPFGRRVRGATVTEGFMVTPPHSPRAAQPAARISVARLIQPSAPTVSQDEWSPEEERDNKVLERARVIAALAREILGPLDGSGSGLTFDIGEVRDALALYVRALGVLQKLIRRVRSRAMGGMSTAYSRMSLSVSLRWATNLEKYRAEFGSLLQEAEHIQHKFATQLHDSNKAKRSSLGSLDSASSCCSDDSGSNRTDCANVLMYYGAMRMGSEAAAAEFAGKSLVDIENQYTSGLLLLEQLFDDAQTPADRETLKSFVAQFRHRQTAVAGRLLANRR